MIIKELKNLNLVQPNQYCIQFDQMIEDEQSYNLFFRHYRFGDMYSILLKRKFRPLDLNLTRNIILQLAKSLQHLKNVGIVHRDLKFENIFVSSFNQKQKTINVVLADFGLSEKMNSNKHYLTKRAGTEGYLSPEILLEKPYSH